LSDDEKKMMKKASHERGCEGAELKDRQGRSPSLFCAGGGTRSCLLSTIGHDNLILQLFGSQQLFLCASLDPSWFVGGKYQKRPD